MTSETKDAPEEEATDTRSLDEMLAELDVTPGESATSDEPSDSAAEADNDDALGYLLSRYGVGVEDVPAHEQETEQPEDISEDKSDEKPDFASMSDAELGQWQAKFGYRTF